MPRMVEAILEGLCVVRFALEGQVTLLVHAGLRYFHPIDPVVLGVEMRTLK